MTRILICGADGQLGRSFRDLSVEHPAWSFTFATRQDLDIADQQSTDHFFQAHAFDYCINCAAYTAVDRAEQERDAAFAINATGVGRLARACAARGAVFIHFSTDYVFHGGRGVPFHEADPVAPQSVYAQSKLQGESEALNWNPSTLVIRTSWVYSRFGHNFVRTMLRLGREKKEVNVVADQIGAPTFAPDLAQAVFSIIARLEAGLHQDKDPFGIYHYSNEGVASWFDFAKAIFELSGVECRVNPIETKDFPTSANRPLYSLLNKSKIKSTFNLNIPYWRDSLRICLLGQ